MQKLLNKLKPAHYVLLSFGLAILAGTICLKTPYIMVDGSTLSWIDALFMSTSATCVTGLSLYNIGTDFTLVGQIIILTLIQLGGLGIMTYSVLFLVFLRGKISITSRLVLTETLIDIQDVINMKKLVRNIILYTLMFELFGMVLLMFFLRTGEHYLVFNALFHSISGFCNAGFSLYSDSLEGYADNNLVLGTMSVLIIVGGLGVVVVKDVFRVVRAKSLKHWLRSVTMQTKVVLSATIFLLFLGTIVFFFTEQNMTMRDQSISFRLRNAFFLSTTSRTAGFNTVPTGEMSEVSRLVTTGLMFIGASPGSTAGGIKTTTFVILFAMILTVIKNRRQIVLFRRKISHEMVLRAATIFIFALILIFLTSLLLLLTEPVHNESIIKGERFFSFLFEVTSAFGTVGLSTGVTPYLSEPGKLIISLMMYIGRIGPLTMALFFAGFEKPLHIGYPEGRVMIG